MSGCHGIVDVRGIFGTVNLLPDHLVLSSISMTDSSSALPAIFRDCPSISPSAYRGILNADPSSVSRSQLSTMSPLGSCAQSARRCPDVGAGMSSRVDLSTVPVSIGGTRRREGSFVLLLGYAGVRATDRDDLLAAFGGGLRAREPARRARHSSARGSQSDRRGQRGRRRPRIESTNEVKKIWTPATTTVAARRATSPWPSEPAPLASQSTTIDDPADQARERRRAAREQTVLERDAAAHPLEERIPHAHEVEAVGARDQPEHDHLDPDDDEQRAADLRVDVELPPEDRQLRQDRG